MATSSAFSMSPVGGFPPPTNDNFPDYIQFRSHGTDLGGPDATVVDFSTGTTATRGTGANSGVITVDATGAGAAILFEDEGTPLGSNDANTVNFTGTGITATRSGGTISVAVPAAPAAQAPLQFKDEGSNLGSTDATSVNFTGAGVTASRTGAAVTVNVPGATAPSFALNAHSSTYTIVIGDANNGLLMTNSSSCNVIVPAHASVAFNVGDAILILQRGAGSVVVVVNTGFGIGLNARTPLTTTLKGQYAAATLINVGVDDWILCGDLA